MLTILKFYSTTCIPCKVLKPILEKLQQEFENRFKVVEVNVESDYALVTTHNVMSVPTLIFLKNGKEVDRYVGSISYDRLKDALIKHL